MLLTRRSFLHSSLVAGLASAAEATRSHWLLSSSGRVRVGVASLGASACEHLALLSAIPGVEIVGLADSDPNRTTKALDQLRELGRTTPVVYRNLDRMLDNRILQAIALPSNGDPESSLILNRIVAAGLPVLTDLPPVLNPQSSSQWYQATLAHHVLVHFRLADFTYPTSSTDLVGWLKRSGMKTTEAQLILPRTMTQQEFRVVAIAATDLLLAASPLNSEGLIRWLGSKEARIQISHAGTIGNIALPQNETGISGLRIHLLGRFPQNAELVLQHESGSMEMAISSQPNASSSLQTVMKFLTQVRESHRVGNSLASRAQVAAGLVDPLIRSLSAHPRRSYR
jgi:hypothetical protein